MKRIVLIVLVTLFAMPLGAQTLPCVPLPFTLAYGEGPSPMPHGPANIWLVQKDSTCARLAATDYNRYVAWSYDGAYFAYGAMRDKLIVLKDDMTKVAELPFSSVEPFAWAHARNVLAFGSFGNLYTFDVATQSLKTILEDLAAAPRYYHNVTFSPNDSLVAFVRHQLRNYASIFIMKADGSNCRQVTDEFWTAENTDLHLSWNADRAIFFWEAGGGAHLLLLDPTLEAGKITNVLPRSGRWIQTTGSGYYWVQTWEGLSQGEVYFAMHGFCDTLLIVPFNREDFVESGNFAYVPLYWYDGLLHLIYAVDSKGVYYVTKIPLATRREDWRSINQTPVRILSQNTRFDGIAVTVGRQDRRK